MKPYDLPLTNRSQGLETTCNDGGAGGKQYTIKHDANGMTHVSDLTIVRCFQCQRTFHVSTTGCTEQVHEFYDSSF